MKDDWDRVQAFISGAQLDKVNGIEGFSYDEAAR